jgi:hypothetical protein
MVDPAQKAHACAMGRRVMLETLFTALLMTALFLVAA